MGFAQALSARLMNRAGTFPALSDCTTAEALVGSRHNQTTFAIAVLSSLAASSLAACSGGGDDNPYALDRKGTKVEVTPIYRDCETDADCTLMDITCNICCVQDAVTTTLAQAFDNERMIACADYTGPVCSCIYEPMAARCQEGQCVAVARGAEASE